MKTLLALIFLLVPVAAHATPVNYKIFFDDSVPFDHVDWTGMFTVDNGIVTSFVAVSPFCSDVAKCTLPW